MDRELILTEKDPSGRLVYDVYKEGDEYKVYLGGQLLSSHGSKYSAFLSLASLTKEPKGG